MAKVDRCTRCGKRWRGQAGWNRDWIAGLEVGLYCSGCQSTQEDLDAQVREIFDPPSQHRSTTLESVDDEVWYIECLVRVYPTPQIMRSKAETLARARTNAAETVALMRQLADEMESGELWDDAQRPPDYRFAQCMHCGRAAPTRVDDFTAWMLAVDPDTDERRGVICPDCHGETRPRPEED